MPPLRMKEGSNQIHCCLFTENMNREKKEQDFAYLCRTNPLLKDRSVGLFGKGVGKDITVFAMTCQSTLESK